MPATAKELKVVELPVTATGKADLDCKKLLRRLQGEADPHLVGSEVKWLTALYHDAPELFADYKLLILDAHPSLCEKFDDIEGVDREGREVIEFMPNELHTMVHLLEAALVTADLLIFQRGGILVEPIKRPAKASKGRMTEVSVFRPIKKERMLYLAASVTSWFTWNKNNQRVHMQPPKDVIQMLLEQGEWIFNHVSGIIEAPTLRPDDSILDKEGYDPTTHLYYHRSPGFKTYKIEKTKEDAEAALRRLRYVLREFPFVDDYDESVALSGMMTPVLRGAIPVSPLHAISATTAGTGKTMLVDTCSGVATGRICAVSSMAGGSEEFTKSLTGDLLGGQSIINIDNCDHPLGGALLCQAVSQEALSIRPLKQSEKVEIESRATFFATGNAMKITGDLADRRTIKCNLDAQCEDPHLRDFKGDPVQEVLADRGGYVADVLTIVSAYIEAGCPDQVKPLRGFEEWSRLVASSLVWLGCANPIDVVKKVSDANPEKEVLRSMLNLWRDHFEAPTRAREVVEKAMRKRELGPKAGEFFYPDLHEHLHAIAGIAGKDDIDTNKLGNWLESRIGRVVDGLRFEKHKKKNDDAVKWAVEGN